MGFLLTGGIVTAGCPQPRIEEQKGFLFFQQGIYSLDMRGRGQPVQLNALFYFEREMIRLATVMAAEAIEIQKEGVKALLPLGVVFRLALSLGST